MPGFVPVAILVFVILYAPIAILATYSFNAGTSLGAVIAGYVALADKTVVRSVVMVDSLVDPYPISREARAKLRGKLEPFDGEVFKTVFDDRTQEDAFFTFDLKDGRVVSALVKAVSPLADFSYDYQDLRLTRVS